MKFLTASAFRQYARNRRFGTCVDCPRTDGEAFPEFCEHTNRYDHNLTLDDLIYHERWSLNHPEITS